MRKTVCIAVLVLAFCCPVSAGVIHNPPPVPLLREPLPETAKVATNGAETAMHGVPYSLTGIILDLLAVLPALF
jgi:hypothetical protein